MKAIKSPGVDGIPPKILKETIQQISMPHVVPFRLERSQHHSFIKKGTRYKSVNYRPVSLTSVNKILKFADDSSPFGKTKGLLKVKKFQKSQKKLEVGGLVQVSFG